MNNMMDIKAIRKSFTRINIVDITALTILILVVFITYKFIFFHTGYFHYKEVITEISFTNVPLENIMQLEVGKNSILGDNESYILIGDDDCVNCNSRNTIHFRYCFDRFYMMDASNSIDLNKNGGSADKLEYYEKEVNPDFIFNILRDGLPRCSANFTFKLRARVLDDGLFYKEYDYWLSEGAYFEAKLNNFTLAGRVKKVYNRSLEVE